MGIFDIFKGKSKNETCAQELTAEQRKQRSIEILKEKSITYIDWLPLRYEIGEVQPRDAREIAMRAFASLMCVQVAFSVQNGNYDGEKEQVIEFFKAHGLLENLTPKEQKIINGQADQQDAVNMIWKYEAFWALLWAMGVTKKLEFPSEICDCEFAMNMVDKFRDFETFLTGVKLRSTGEILAELDLIYRYHWACVNKRANPQNNTQTAGLDESVVMERRAGLEWLCCKGAENDDIHDKFNAWDYPDLNT